MLLGQWVTNLAALERKLIRELDQQIGTAPRSPNEKGNDTHQSGFHARGRTLYRGRLSDLNLTVFVHRIQGSHRPFDSLRVRPNTSADIAFLRAQGRCTQI